MVKLSIILPVYNAEKHLKRCLKSIPNDPNVELIVIDDASTDHSLEILQSSGCKVITHTTNMGVSATRNHGIDIATGEYITFIDADDEYVNGGISMILSEILAHPVEDIIQFNHFREYANGCRKLKFYNKRGHIAVPEMPLMWMTVWNKVYKSSLINDIRFLVNLNRGEDELFVLDCVNKTKKIYCADTSVYIKYINTPGCLSTSATKSDLLDEQMALINFMRSCDDFKVCQAIANRMSSLWTDNPTYNKIFRSN